MGFGNEQVQTLQGWKLVFLHHLVMKFIEVISFPLQVVCFFPAYTGEAILTRIYDAENLRSILFLVDTKLDQRKFLDLTCVEKLLHKCHQNLGDDSRQ
jgi:hypothetical protein